MVGVEVSSSRLGRESHPRIVGEQLSIPAGDAVAPCDVLVETLELTRPSAHWKSVMR